MFYWAAVDFCVLCNIHVSYIYIYFRYFAKEIFLKNEMNINHNKR